METVYAIRTSSGRTEYEDSQALLEDLAGLLPEIDEGVTVTVTFTVEKD
jgi:hypothetical protein